MGLTAIPMRADTGPIGGDLSYEFIVLADTGESAVFCDKHFLDKPMPGDDTDFSDDLKSPIFNDWTSLFAATDEMPDEADLGRDCRTTTGCRRAASRSATFSTSAPSIPSRWAPRHRARRQGNTVLMGSYGIGPIAAGAGDHRGQPRRCRHHLAGRWRRSRSVLINLKAGDAECDRDLRRRSTPS